MQSRWFNWFFLPFLLLQFLRTCKNWYESRKNWIGIDCFPLKKKIRGVASQPSIASIVEEQGDVWKIDAYVARDTTHQHLGRAENRAGAGGRREERRVKCNQCASNPRDAEQEGNLHSRCFLCMTPFSVFRATCARIARGSLCLSVCLSLCVSPVLLAHCN